MNVVMLQPTNGAEARFVEVQGTAEGLAFTRGELDELLDIAAGGLTQIIALQNQLISSPPAPKILGR
jgi:ribonuclease PH